MKSIKDMTNAQLPAFIESHLLEKGIYVVLSGGLEQASLVHHFSNTITFHRRVAESRVFFRLPGDDGKRKDATLRGKRPCPKGGDCFAHQACPELDAGSPDGRRRIVLCALSASAVRKTSLPYL